MANLWYVCSESELRIDFSCEYLYARLLRFKAVL